MTDFSKMTKADLLQQVGALSQRVTELEARPVAEAPKEPVVVPEAQALGNCIRTLDWLADRPKTNNSYGYQQTNVGPIDRVLRTLAAKYGIPLVETRYEACSRRHLDELSAQDIVRAVGGLS